MFKVKLSVAFLSLGLLSAGAIQAMQEARVARTLHLTREAQLSQGGMIVEALMGMVMPANGDPNANTRAFNDGRSRDRIRYYLAYGVDTISGTPADVAFVMAELVRLGIVVPEDADAMTDA